MADDDLAAEHEQLKQQTEALQREHDELSSLPDADGSLRTEHRLNLQHKIAELQAHMAKLQSARERRELSPDLAPDPEVQDTDPA